MRVTRARAQQGSDETIDATERAPLNDISPNASPEQAQLEEELPSNTPAKTPATKTKTKGRAKKGKKGKAVEEEEPAQVVLDEKRQAAGSPASDAAVDDLGSGPSSDVAPVPTTDDRPASPPSKAVRLTRRQLAKQEEDMRQSQRATSPLHEPEAEAQDVPEVTEEVADVPQEEAIAGAQDTQTEDAQEEPRMDEASPEEEHVEDAQEELSAVTPSVEITSEEEPKTLAAEKPTEDAVTPLRSHTSSRRASRSPSKSPMRLEESFEAIDALEEALENVTSVTSFDHPIEEKSPRKKQVPKTTGSPNTRSKTPKMIPAVAEKISRTPSAAAPKSLKPTKTSSLARASSARVAPSKDLRMGSTDTVDYLASKRRPISMSFPTPPPPPKGRAPTKPTFQLSSNNVVAKLKAQKEEREKREAEGVAPPKQRPVSMPPPPRSTKPPTKPTFQLPGEKVAEKLKAQKEERLRREAEAPRQSISRPVSISMAPHAKSTKALTKPTFELPGAAVAEKLRLQKEERLKRQEEAETDHQAAPRSTSIKMAPHAKTSKPPTKPTFELPGAAVAEKLKLQKEERLKRQEEAEADPQAASRSINNSMVPHAKSSKPPTKATFELPGAAVAEKLKLQKEERLKRMEEADAAKKEAALKTRQGPIRKPLTVPILQQPGPVPQTQTQHASSLASKRSSVMLSQPLSQSRSTSTSSANRNSVLIAKSTVTPVDAAQQKLKGREVFNRDRMEKESRDRERKDKEDGAKKARAEAAERGRIASREWAEKQRKKMMGV
ncbi:hypothetical protein EJ02DRAFT_435255 [Clathrospora elynae]|uniref:Carboxylesterase family protein n=1 Tax=Clathrospora elynae TaxID=706981 RepID=A0A6A5SUV3_9PLEO|nr:hypothetical protein EJ02DRAFT_435255 [Clathrospora elynae]